MLLEEALHKLALIQRCECILQDEGVLNIKKWSQHMTFYRTIVTINVYAEFKLLEVKVPLDFLGTEGFSPRQEGRYIVKYSTSRQNGVTL